MGSFLPVFIRHLFETRIRKKKVETPPVSVGASERMHESVWRKKNSMNHVFDSEDQGRYLFCWVEVWFCSQTWVNTI